MKDSIRVVIGLVAGLVGGILIALSHRTAWLDAADAIAPVGTLWVNAIRMTVIPLVVSLLITGIASASDVSAIGRTGGRTIVVFVVLLGATAIVVVPLASFLFALLPLPASGGARAMLPAGAAEAAKQL